MLAPVTQIPPELDKLFVCVDHKLPDHAQLKKSGLVSIHRGSESFDQLGGLDNLKAFCLRAMRRQSEGTVSNRPRGVLLGNLVGQSERLSDDAKKRHSRREGCHSGYRRFDPGKRARRARAAHQPDSD